MSSTAIVLRREIGVGDAASDVASGLNSVIALLQQTKQAVGNDLVVGPQLTNAIAQLQAVQTSFGPAVDTIKTLQAQLAACNAKPAQTIVTTPSATPAAPAAGVAPTTAGFIAVGSALVGGIAGYVARGKMRRG